MIDELNHSPDGSSGRAVSGTAPIAGVAVQLSNIEEKGTLNTR